MILAKTIPIGIRHYVYKIVGAKEFHAQIAVTSLEKFREVINIWLYSNVTSRMWKEKCQLNLYVTKFLTGYYAPDVHGLLLS